MKTKRLSLRKSHRLKLALLLVASIAYAVFFALAVISSSREIKRASTEVERLKAELHAQRSLLPIHALLERGKTRSLPEGVHAHERQPLDLEDLASIPEVFEGLAKESGVELILATPEARSLREGRAMLRVDTLMQGEFLTFNSLLNRLMEMQFVEAIESLGIEITDSGQEMSLSVWLAIQ